jgi:RimJ/RimL family protein N-acetyltransferase
METERLVIRPFELTDLDLIHAILNEAFPSDPRVTLDERREWLAWSVLNHAQLALIHQPPYGDRAIVLKATGELIGACGYVPCLCPFGQLPGWPDPVADVSPIRTTNEMGLFYAMDAHRRLSGYTAEAAEALIAYAFQTLMLKRIVATTSFDNEGSMAVMRRVGMTILKNPKPEPSWLQVVGVLEHNQWRGAM